MKNIIYILLLLMLITSCASKKDLIYFQDKNDSIQQNDNLDLSFTPPTLKVDDRITINVSSFDLEAARPFNLTVTSYSNVGTSLSNPINQQTYLIEQDGTINFPQIGKIKAAGLTRSQLEKNIEDSLKIFLPDAKVTILIVNFRISVLGEVLHPGEYVLTRDKTNIVQALGMAGDLTIYGNRKLIKVLREVDGKMNYYTLDLTSKDIVTSPVFYLQQNDIIYVEPNKPRVNAAASSPTAQYIISATGLFVTIISILTR